MDDLPFDKLVAILDNPYSLDLETMALVKWWMRPRTITSNLILEAMVQAGITQTNSEVRRLIQQGGVIWNGQKISTPDFALSFIDNFWGVFKVGKRHVMVEKNG
jgi:tyrosyl-tRNA synthetase